MSTVAKPTITVPFKWQKRMAKELNEKQDQNKFQKSQQGNTKVYFIPYNQCISFLIACFIIQVCIVSCKDATMNHYSGQSYG